MKIGLLTFHDTTNFGSFLQTYGLYTAINRQGYECEIIDYKCDAIVDRELPPQKPKNFSIREIAKFVILSPIIRRKYNVFQKSLTKYMNISPSYYRKDIKNVNRDYDAFVAGSDILWDLRLTEDDTTYFLDFAEGDKKKIAFSTSVGERWHGEHDELARRLVKRLDCIALREKESASWLKEYVSQEVYSVCDPTMLIQRETWDKMANTSCYQSWIKGKDYVLVYFPTESILEDAKKYAEKHELKVWVINYGLPIKGVKNIKPLGVEDFLCLIRGAQIVLTSSYHGVLFSLYFEKAFYCYLRENSHNVRFESLMEKINLNGCIRNPKELFRDPEIDYKQVSERIGQFREQSMTVLKDFLEN